jgi:2'-5' RNA ligase
MRAFLALDIPSKAADLIVNISKAFYGNVEGRYVKREHMHSTLFFFENFKGSTDDIAAFLKNLSINEMLVNFTGVNFFTYKMQPTVLFADFNSDGADYLYETCRNFLLESKVPFDQKPFKKHITLCRIKAIKDMELFKKEIAIQNKKLDDSVFNFESVTFYRSTLTKNGPIYEVLAKREFI